MNLSMDTATNHPATAMSMDLSVEKTTGTSSSMPPTSGGLLPLLRPLDDDNVRARKLPNDEERPEKINTINSNDIGGESRAASAMTTTPPSNNNSKDRRCSKYSNALQHRSPTHKRKKMVAADTTAAAGVAPCAVPSSLDDLVARIAAESRPPLQRVDDREPSPRETEASAKFCSTKKSPAVASDTSAQVSPERSSCDTMHDEEGCRTPPPAPRRKKRRFVLNNRRNNDALHHSGHGSSSPTPTGASRWPNLPLVAADGRDMLVASATSTTTTTTGISHNNNAGERDRQQFLLTPRYDCPWLVPFVGVPTMTTARGELLSTQSSGSLLPSMLPLPPPIFSIEAKNR